MNDGWVTQTAADSNAAQGKSTFMQNFSGVRPLRPVDTITRGYFLTFKGYSQSQAANSPAPLALSTSRSWSGRAAGCPTMAVSDSLDEGQVPQNLELCLPPSASGNDIRRRKATAFVSSTQDSETNADPIAVQDETSLRPSIPTKLSFNHWNPISLR
jgi:hypothetical protein